MAVVDLRALTWYSHVDGIVNDGAKQFVRVLNQKPGEVIQGHAEVSVAAVVTCWFSCRYLYLFIGTCPGDTIFGMQRDRPVVLPRILTPEGSQILSTRSGPYYEPWLAKLRELNPAASNADVEIGIQQLFGPTCPEECFHWDKYWRLALVPEVSIVNGVVVRILESNLFILAKCMVGLAGTSVGLHKSFGGLDGYSALRALHVAEGGDGEAMDREIVNRARAWLQTTITEARHQLSEGTN